MENTMRKLLSIVLMVAMTSVQFGALVPPVSAGAPDDDLKQIQYKYYFRGNYSQAVPALLTYLSRTDLTAESKVAAREFLAASYVLSGDATRGQDEFMRLLTTHIGYSGPDPSVFKVNVIGVYESARDEYASTRIRSVPEEITTTDAEPSIPVESSGKPLYKRWWFYAGLVTALLIAGAVSKEEQDDPVAARDTGTISVGVRTQ